ncbi:S24 family peptidase [Clostridium uliginosum]|uniref:DNA 3'-5' helicase n=1 Tax=Clostridium uliginosum TaxID=119641 RepID=A0A1I1JKX2_9CLOT|nr:S24 family peptidase [Clostridium uliginosum]SFC49249.1 SOS regulatory protein LexA [Clostridium uliginosum]
MQLNVEQKRIIESKPNGHSLIKGVAGSGKTTVAVNKIPLLLRHYCTSKDDRVLMATYNKSLQKYVSFIYDSVKDEINTQTNLFDEDNSDKLYIKTIDSIMFSYFSQYKKQNNIKVELASSKECQNELIDAINFVSNRYENVKIINSKYLQFIKEEIMWIKACNYMEIQEYQCVDRIGRVSKVNNDGPQKLRKNSEQRNSIFEVLIKYDSNLKKINKLDFQDMALLALVQARKYPIKKYTHILIDESQDLTRVQLEFLKALYNEKTYSSITFISDVAQSIYPQAWLVKKRSFTSLGYDMTGKSNSLSKNYRTTTQIAQAAFSLINSDEDLIQDDNFVKPNLIDKQGEYPIYINFKNTKEEGSYIANLITKNLMKGYELKDIVIIARLRNQLKEFKECLEKHNIHCSIFDNSNEFDFAKECVKLVTMHSIKGLEFKVVIIAGLNSRVMPLCPVKNEEEDMDMLESRERKLLYVGMTRATEKLFITSNGTPSKLIKDIDYRYLRIKLNCDMRRISSISIEDYLFKEDITDIYCGEEKIRQWILREIKEVYKYPLNLVAIEQKVNIGSQIKFADIAIDIFRNKVKGPYILIETKAWGSGIGGALSQLKSYMANTPSTQYGIATDGNELVIINRDLEEIDDIPKYDSSMIPLTLETIEYIDFKRNVSHKFIKDSSSIGEIYIEENGAETKVENVRAVPVFNEIAAGTPILINDSLQGKYYLPTEWVGNSNDVFILKIKGDSMINKNIDDRDYVVINKQNAANIGDIVAVDIEGNSTLKTYKSMGGKILLMPENDNYEPIMLEEDQFSIIGVAIGLIKN